MNKKTVLITGAAKRLGKDLCHYFASNSYDIALSYNKSNKDAINLKNTLKKEYKINCKIYKANLFNTSDTKKLIAQVIRDFPNLNLLVNNASIFNRSSIFDSESELMNNFSVHFFSPLILSKAFYQNVKNNNIENAQIINMVDKNIVRYDTQNFYYLLSKKMLAELTKMSCLEFAPIVRVNAVAPGYILDDEFLASSPKIKRDLIKKIPLQKKGNAENIIKTFDFLEKNNFVNGQILFIDGASSLNHAG